MSLARTQSPARTNATPPAVGRRAALALALTLCAGCSPKPADADRLPSIILISLDTLRADHVGFMGYERDTTPFLDELAAESMIFDQAYTTMSWTLIAHMSLFTGLYPSQHKVWTPKSVLSDSVPTLTQELKARGYHTMGFHFPGWLDPDFGFGRDFDVYLPHDNLKQAGAHINKALAERPADKPYFLFIHLFDIHNVPVEQTPSRLYRCPPPYDELFLPGANELLADKNSFEQWNYAHHGLSPDQHDAIVAQYDGGIRQVDDELRTWANEWRTTHNFDDTLLIITSDHGEGLAQRRKRYAGHGDTFEEGLHVPLLFRFPNKLHANTRISSPASQVDILPTILDYITNTPTPHLPGYSLLRGRPIDAMLLAENEHMEVLYRWPHKLVRKRGTGEGNGILTNLAEDPLEANSLRSAQDPEAFLRLANSLRAQAAAEATHWQDPAAANPTEAPLDADQLRALEALGYTGDN
jgi:arylsulfatase